MLTKDIMKRLPDANVSEMICFEGFFYLATPFAKVSRAYAMQIAADATFKLLKKKIFCISPILHTSSIDTHSEQYTNMELLWDHSDFLKYDSSIMKGACGLVILDDEASLESLGMWAEYNYFDKSHKPIYKLNLETFK